MSKQYLLNEKKILDVKKRDIGIEEKCPGSEGARLLR
jgi:hypothetical protein